MVWYGMVWSGMVWYGMATEVLHTRTQPQHEVQHERLHRCLLGRNVAVHVQTQK